MQEAQIIRGRAVPGAGKPLAFIVSGNTPLLAIAAGLHAAGLATLVAVGDVGEPGPTDEVPLAGGLAATVRTGELLYADGTTGAVPDLVVDDAPSEGGEFASAAINAALERVRRQPMGNPPKRTPVPIIGSRRPERDDSQMAEPPLAYRLLALFRLWNAVQYFFPCKHLMERNWDNVLAEVLPRFMAAGDALAYGLAVAELTAQLHDTHALATGGALDAYVGTHVPAVVVRWVEGQSVVTRLLPGDGTEEPAPVAIGDIVVAVDGEAAEARRERLAGSIAASTPQSLQQRIHTRLLAGGQGSEAAVRLRRQDGELTTVRLRRNRPFFSRPAREGPVVTVLPEGYGYIDLTRLTIPEVDTAFEAVRQTPAVIFDLRGMPGMTFWVIAPRLAGGDAVGARFMVDEHRTPSRLAHPSHEFGQTLSGKSSDAGLWLPPFLHPAGSAAARWRYQGRVVALINEEAVSLAEHTCLFLEAAGATFVGSATAGANGDVTRVSLPGGIRVSFSGAEVRHADGRQLQRVGILPHVEVHPTIEGLRAGRDEVLAAALDWLARPAGRG